MSTERETTSSPHQVSRLRSTRVASLSPIAPIRGRRGRQETPDREAKRSTSRWRSESRTVRGSVDEEGGNGGEEVGRGRGLGMGKGWAKAKSMSRSGSRRPSTKGGAKERIAAPTKADLEAGTLKGEKGESEDQDAIVRLLPHPIPHFLGYRRPVSQLHAKHQHIKPYPAILPFVHHIPPMVESIVWTWIGAFVGIAAVSLIFARPNHFSSSSNLPPHSWMSPVIVGSFGASSVLLYATPASPLGQPRSFVGGQFFSALTGVCVTKLFRLSIHYNLMMTDNGTSLVWLAGAISTACALVVMMITGTLHPPGGATALLCATNSQVEQLGWKVIPVVLLSSIVMLVWSLIWMNLGRKRYPESFVSPSPPEAKAGNLSQAIYLYLCQLKRPAQPKIDVSPRQTTPPVGVEDEWQDEAGWGGIAEENEEERQERQSRWAAIPSARSTADVD